nr:uncharacterized protein LOC123278208 [Equus asinus]
MGTSFDPVTSHVEIYPKETVSGDLRFIYKDTRHSYNGQPTRGALLSVHAPRKQGTKRAPCTRIQHPARGQERPADAGTVAGPPRSPPARRGAGGVGAQRRGVGRLALGRLPTQLAPPPRKRKAQADSLPGPRRRATGCRTHGPECACARPAGPRRLCARVSRATRPSRRARVGAAREPRRAERHQKRQVEMETDGHPCADHFASFLKYILSIKRDQNMSKNTTLETS